MDSRPPGPEERARRLLNTELDRGRTPGLQYMVLDATQVRFELAAGWAHIAQRVPLTTATTLMAYSMSKTVTAAAVLRLAADGAFRVDDLVAPLVPHPYGPTVTVRHLLAHLAGIPNPIPLRWVHPAARHATFDEAAALATVLAAHPRPTAPPGTRYRYSNIGYWLLGALVERASGQPFPAFVERRIFAPLGISPDQLGYTIPDPARQAHGYLEKYSVLNLTKRLLIDRKFIGPYEGSWLRILDHYPNGAAFGGLVGSARGFAKFLQDALRPESALLDGETRALFFDQQRTNAGRLVPMTLGWHVGPGGRFYFKEGGGGGFHHEMRIYPGASIATVVMANATQFAVKQCLNEVDRQFLPAA